MREKGDVLNAIAQHVSIAWSRLACFFLGHDMDGEQSSFDGEWHPYCRRCEGEEPNDRANSAGYFDTIPGAFALTYFWFYERLHKS